MDNEYMHVRNPVIGLIGASIGGLICLLCLAPAAAIGMQSVDISEPELEIWQSLSFAVRSLVNRDDTASLSPPLFQFVDQRVDVNWSDPVHGRYFLDEWCDRVPALTVFYHPTSRRISAEYGSFLESLELSPQDRTVAAMIGRQKETMPQVATSPRGEQRQVMPCVVVPSLAEFESGAPRGRSAVGALSVQIDRQGRKIDYRESNWFARIQRTQVSLGKDRVRIASRVSRLTLTATNAGVAEFVREPWYAESVIQLFRNGPFKESANRKNTWGPDGAVPIVPSGAILMRGVTLTLVVDNKDYVALKSAHKAGNVLDFGPFSFGGTDLKKAGRTVWSDGERTIKVEYGAAATLLIAIVNRVPGE